MRSKPFLFLFIVFGTIVNAQDLKEFSEINVIPPSPNTAAFQKFVEIPVSLYTGTPNISVPIYEIKMKQLSLPISLQYHASGLKVDEHASWVGAGWSLSVGGMISRTSKGFPDELNTSGKKGLFYNTRLFNTNGTVNMQVVFDPEGSEGHVFTPEDPWTTADSVAIGALDLQPDLFVFSFPGGSGRFSFPFNTLLGNNKPIKYTDDDITILEHPFDDLNDFPSGNFGNADYKWKIQTPDGTVYTFDLAERTQVLSVGGKTLSPYNPSFGYFQNTWQLTRIENNGEWINFEYEQEIQHYTRNYSETKGIQITGSINPQTSSSSYTITDVTAQRLSAIYTSEGDRINFIANTERLDLEGSKRLDFISIYKGGYPVKFHKLSYSYFGANDKLKLDSVIPIAGLDNDAERLNGYQFDYFPGTIPSMGSSSQDFWGFYNGQTNSGGLIPPFKTDEYHVNRASTTSRLPDLSSTRIGTIKSISYPTGGQSIFEYELNSYFDENHMTTYKYEALAEGTSEVTKRFKVLQDCSATLIEANNPTIDSYTELRKWNGSSYVKVTLPNNPQGNRRGLSAGDYELFASQQGVGSVKIVIEYEQEEATEVNVGGLRVHRVTSQDPVEQLSITKRYAYESDSLNSSSGVLFTHPSIGGYVTTQETGSSGEGQGALICTFIARGTFINLSSYTQVPLAIYNGSHIGYTEVKEYASNERANTMDLGYSKFIFLNEKDENVASYPYVPSRDFSFKNGKVKLQEVYEKKGGAFYKVKSIDNNYTQRQLSGTTGGINFQRIRSTYCYEFTLSDYTYNEYFIRPTWYNLSRTVTSDYDENGNAVLTNIIEYEYDTEADLNLPKSKFIYTNEAEVLKEEYTRDADYPALITEYKKLTRLSAEDSFKVIAGRKVNYYGKRPEDLYLWVDEQQSWIWRNHLVYQDNQLLENVTYPNLTDNNGDSKTSYIYGYQQVYPVIEANNIDYNTLSSAVAAAINSLAGYANGLADLDNLLNEVNYSTSSNWQLWKDFNQNLRTQIGLKDAQLSTYTYKPGAGITSVTDINGITNYYEYDSFNRLRLIKDQDMNIIKEMYYHYRDQN
jgi:hypothetical protein